MVWRENTRGKTEVVWTYTEERLWVYWEKYDEDGVARIEETWVYWEKYDEDGVARIEETWVYWEKYDEDGVARIEETWKAK